MKKLLNLLKRLFHRDWHTKRVYKRVLKEMKDMSTDDGMWY